MRLSTIYSNLPNGFRRIDFNPGLNVVLGDIRDPENRDKSVHNLGKTTLARVIDFCLCRKKDPKFFLFKHEEMFKDFVFFLELETLSGQYLTIRRSVAEASKLSFATHPTPRRNLVDSDSADWDHEYVGFDSGKQILDGLLGLSAVKPWDFRVPVGYSLRTQSDFTDVFQLAKNAAGKHRYWKPYVAHILGFDAQLVVQGYDIEDAIEALKQKIATLRLELGAADIDLDEVRGLIKIKEEDVSALQAAADKFDFEINDSAINTEVVEQLDAELAELNTTRYSLSRTRKRIVDSLQAENIQFRPNAARKLFEEAGVVFPYQVKREFDDLVRFNREIAEERIEYLKAELELTSERLASTTVRIDELNKRRQSELHSLSDADSVSKYRDLNERLVAMKNDLSSLERQREALLGIRQKETELKKLKRELEDQNEALQNNVDQQGAKENGRYIRVRAALADLCNQFLGHKALITTRVNAEGHLDFEAEFLDTHSHPTSEDDGKSYKQALCAAYDLAIAKVLLREDFLRFVYHDGLLEGMDDRIKLNMIKVLRDLADQGIQQILTVIDSDLPIDSDGQKFSFDDDEVVRTLHDGGPEGRLFNSDIW
ncbi:DUF2326 domain-containing protein [Fuerstiella marisgermanici]|uniref:SH3 domain protein n=1 Tax=Fuerstiella marisgermanici TaxID=1891926 RepID=A0A1P8WMV9_9PLAN|nr:DUF2326 domain-containing protein [Fuerstiella marisgermanici]APZ95367.1 SH3 domain protein [Fuerstiella marisgermanici]